MVRRVLRGLTAGRTKVKGLRMRGMLILLYGETLALLVKFGVFQLQIENAHWKIELVRDVEGVYLSLISRYKIELKIWETSKAHSDVRRKE